MVCGVGIIIALVVIGALTPETPEERERLAAAARRDEALASQPASGVTMANFQRLETGMSYPEVVTILGQSGEEMSRSELAGYTTVMYSWKKGAFGSNMNAMFQNGKLISKAQFGL